MILKNETFTVKRKHRRDLRRQGTISFEEESVKIPARSVIAAMAATNVAFTSVSVGTSSARAFPTKPIRLMVPFARGRCAGSQRGGFGWGGDGARPPGLWYRVLRVIASMVVASTLLSAATLFA